MGHTGSLLLGLDIGTSGLKAAVFMLNGLEITRAYRPYKTTCSKEGFLSLSPRTVSSAAAQCLGELAQRVDFKQLEAMAVSTQGEAVVLVDENCEPLADAIVSFDNRNEEECRDFLSRFERSDVYARTGMPAHSMFTATKLLWIARHQPELMERARWFVNFDAYIAMQLGIEPYIVSSMASRTMLYDITKRSFIEEYCAFCQIDTKKLPPVVFCGTDLGRTAARAAQLNFISGVRVIAGNHDQLCCAVGAGLTREGSAMSSMGTTESMVAVSSKLTLREDLYQSSIPVYDYVMTGSYAYMTFLTACASLLAWFKDDVLRSQDDFYERFEAQASARNRLSRVIFLPYLYGSGTPTLNPQAKGVFEGVSVGCSDLDLYLAILQSISCEERLNCENMQRSGIQIDQIRCIGGGARSDLWLQLKAIFTGKEVVTINAKETGCLGAALIAGVGSGVFSSYDEAGAQCVRVKRVFHPLDQYQRQVEEYYSRYLKLKETMQTFWQSEER